CESSAKNVLSEASSLFTAAQLFIQAEDKLDSINAVSYSENADCATMCLLRAAKIYENGELFTLAANVYIYLCDTLMRRKRWGETLPFLKRASEIVSRDLMCSLQVLRRLAACQLNMHDWPGALNTCLRIQAMIVDPERNGDTFAIELCGHYWVTAEVFRVLLILLTCPSQRLTTKDNQGYSLDRYLVCDERELSGNTQFPHLDEDLFLHLQSLVVSALNFLPDQSRIDYFYSQNVFRITAAYFGVLGWLLKPEMLIIRSVVDSF
ncbi:hypothetical protein FBUS_06009, partial [Fasciolopsis buskii]